MSASECTREDDLLVFSDDPTGSPQETAFRAGWNVLVADDDEDVHQTTEFALRGVAILDRPVNLLHASSAAEARRLMEETPDVAAALVDVVMETPDAGLRLVRDLREAGFRETRIVLRTGQPGYAPELNVISAYEIDDYRTKSELTQVRLITVLTAALRAYDQIRRISQNRAGLELIVRSASHLFQRTSFEMFSRGLLTQIASLLGVEPSGFVCAETSGQDGRRHGRIVSAAGRFAGFIGKPLEILEDGCLRDLWSGETPCLNPSLHEGGMSFVFSSSGHDRLLVCLDTGGRDISAEGMALLQLFSTNISIGFENLALVERLNHLAYIDPGLEIPNLNAFLLSLAGRSESPAEPQRVALMSLDGFDDIVAVRGLQTANSLLQAVHRTLTGEEMEGVFAARVGDGTFALLGGRGVLTEERLSRILAAPYAVDGVEIPVSATTILIDLANGTVDPQDVMRSASSALLHMRRTHRGKCLPYTGSMRSDVERRFSLRTELRRAVRSGEGFSVAMQPKARLTDGAVVGAEALLRWTWRDEAVPPAEFIPIAESGGLTQELTDFVSGELGRWNAGRGGLPALPVAINLSMADLNNPGFAARLLSSVAAAGLTPESVEFEVTEGFVMNTTWAIDQLWILKDHGFRIALDDFGTGYSSLGYFHRLPIDTLKIDKAFVSPLTIPTARHSMAAIAVNMAQTYNVECVAEGIETAEQAQILAFLGCPVGQGYFFGRPVPLDSFSRAFLGQ